MGQNMNSVKILNINLNRIKSLRLCLQLYILTSYYTLMILRAGVIRYFKNLTFFVTDGTKW